MKILVTGGAGFIGSHVVDSYIQAGHEVVIVDNMSTGRGRNLNLKATFYQLDLRDPQLDNILAQEKPDIINHHAAQIDVRRSVADPMFDASVNILGSLNLLESARKHNVQRFIYISTGGAVYGEPEYLPCDEAHPINPICPYGASKHTVEHYLFMYHQNYGLNYTILRYPNVYGPRQDPLGEAGVVSIFTQQMLKNMPTTIFGDGEQERDFVYVGDCARANVLALTAQANGIFNLGTGQSTSINQLFVLLKQITHYQHDVTYGPARLGETRRIYLSAAKAGEFLGWEPTTDLLTGLTQTVSFFQKVELTS
jgi:UDP-glucose 4-epimerase